MGGQCLAKGKQQPWEKGIVGNDIQSPGTIKSAGTFFIAHFTTDHFSFFTFP